jgi:hypothetical protein
MQDPAIKELLAQSIKTKKKNNKKRRDAQDSGTTASW